MCTSYMCIDSKITSCVQSIVKGMPLEDLFVKELFVRKDTSAAHCCRTDVSFLALQGSL